LTGVGEVKFKRPSIRDNLKEEDTSKENEAPKLDSEMIFNSKFLPKFLRMTKELEDFIPWLYLNGISMDNIGIGISKLAGHPVSGLSATMISDMCRRWESDYELWSKREIQGLYPYIFVDGVYFGVRGDKENQCVLVVLGVSEDGDKELLGLSDGYSENTESWRELFIRLREQGLKGPRLAVGDGGLGAWSALREVYPDCEKQLCWFHAIKSAQSHLPKKRQRLALTYLREIYMSSTREDAVDAMRRYEEVYGDKYPKSVEVLKRERDALLTFYGYPGGHWRSIRTSNICESMFSTVKHRTNATRGMGTRRSVLSMVFKLSEIAAKKFRKFYRSEELRAVARGEKYKDGLPVGKGGGKSI
jgi:transposase-like protein